MSLPVLKVAVVGHTNTGKTSLLRTLMRDSSFGEISNRPATTRHVEGARLFVNGAPLIELYDTPGLEDSIGLLEHLDDLRDDRRATGIQLVERFLDSPTAQGEYHQEAKALRQVLASDTALYVIDARDRVLGKYRDELEILGRCARPVVPVLNFVASPEAKTAEWREHLARINMHAVAEFDTVVFDAYEEQRLFQKIQTLLDPFRATLDAVIEDRVQERARLNHASADRVADMLLDAAAYVVIVPADDEAKNTAAMAALKETIRQSEQRCVDALLELHRFRVDDYTAKALPIDEGQWGYDVFNTESMRQFGITAGGGAAAGGMAGLAIDAITGGMTLGAAAALGAAIGALVGSSSSHGRRLADLMRGHTELRVNEATLRHLAVREISLVQALLHRGHASQERINTPDKAAPEMTRWTKQRLPAAIEQARSHPGWSRLNESSAGIFGEDAGRRTAKAELVRVLEAQFARKPSPASARE